MKTYEGGIVHAKIARYLNRCADAAEVKIVVCHVLRYTPLFMKLKDLIVDGKVRSVMFINQNVVFLLLSKIQTGIPQSHIFKIINIFFNRLITVFVFILLNVFDSFNGLVREPTADAKIITSSFLFLTLWRSLISDRYTLLNREERYFALSSVVTRDKISGIPP